MGKRICVEIEEEKLRALRMFAEQRGVSLEEELIQATEAMYQKIVPSNVRSFLDAMPENRKPKKKTGNASSVGD